MPDIYFGNAKDDGQDTRGWIIGNFIPQDLRHSNLIELKYGVHTAGEARREWVTGELRTTLFILQTGRFAMKFKDHGVLLEHPGDYVVWGPGTDHQWEALEDCVGITIRWLEAK